MITKAVAVTKEYVKVAFGTMAATTILFALISFVVQQPSRLMYLSIILAATAALFFLLPSSTLLKPVHAMFDKLLLQRVRKQIKREYLPNAKGSTTDESPSVKPKEISLTRQGAPGFVVHSPSQNLWIVMEVKTNALRTALLPSLTYAQNDSDTIVSYIRAHESHMRAYGIQHVNIWISHADADHLSVAFRTALTRSDTLDLDLYKDMIYSVFWFSAHDTHLKITDKVSEQFEQFDESEAINAF